MATSDHTNEQNSDRAGVSGLTPVQEAQKPYDATRDPRTGRPPNQLEAQRLAREHELEQLERAQTPADVEKIYRDDQSPEVEGPKVSDDDREPDEDWPKRIQSQEQAPARMTSPHGSDGAKAAADALVQEGISRERAEELVEAHGTDWGALKAAAWPENVETNELPDEEPSRKTVLEEHHREGIPPFETPGEKD